MTVDQFRTRFAWDTDPIKACWTNIRGERLRNSNPKVLPLASLRRDEGAPPGRRRSGASQRIHRLAYETFIGPCAKTPRQTCGNMLCFNPEHLKPEGRNGWKRTALCKCQKCGESKLRAEMREVGKRHYKCKIHEVQRREHLDFQRCPSCGRLKKKATLHKEYNDLIFDSGKLCSKCGYEAFIEWRKLNAEKIKEYERARAYGYWKTKYENDKAYRILECCRRRLRKLISSNTNTTPERMLQLIGCSKERLVQHLESHFIFGMTWENHGAWHIDHIRACSTFDLEDPNQLRQCFNWTNLQPLWARDNIKKSGPRRRRYVLV